MRFAAAAATVVFATLFSTVCALPTIDGPPSADAAAALHDKRQVGVSVAPSVQVSVAPGVQVSGVVTVNAVLGSTQEQLEQYTRNINNTVNSIDGNSTWIMRNNAMQSVRADLNQIGALLAATTAQISTLGGNIGGDLNAVANATLGITNEVIYTLQNVVQRLGPGVVTLLGIIINNVLSVLAGLMLGVDIMARGSLPVVYASLRASLPSLSPAVSSIVQGLGFLLGYK